MSHKFQDFQNQIDNAYAKAVWNPNRLTELQAVSTALASDTRTHDQTIETGAGILAVKATNTRLTNDIDIHLGKALASNLTQSQMIAAMGIVGGYVTKPGQITRPFISSNATPPIVGSILTTTNGVWAGGTTGFTYQWQRDGVNIAAATAQTYTLVSADVGASHRLTCNVTATNAQGSTPAMPSNVITVP